MKITVALAVIPLVFSACTTPPPGSTVTALPAPGKPFEAFAEDDVVCKNFASTQVAAGPGQAHSAVVGSALVGTLVGAALGGAIGGGRGAGIGEAGGTLIGTGAGASNNTWSQMSLQQRYNSAYMQWR